MLNARAALVACLMLTLILAAGVVGVPTSPPPTAQAAAASTITDAPTGSVYGMTVGADGTTYAVGAFTSVGAATGGVANLSAATGLVNRSFPPVNGVVRTSISDGAGGFFIGGDFTYVDGQARGKLAHILADGTLDGAWAPSADGTVVTMVRVGSTLYIGGEFTAINGTPRSRIAALSTGTGALQSWNPGADAGVYALAIDDSAVYAGGNFTTIGGQPLTRLAAFDINTQALLTGWTPNANLSVYSIVPRGNVVYAGGNFTNIGGASRNRLAAVSAVAVGSGTATTWDPNVGGQVDALAIDDTTIYAVGAFTTAGGLTRNRGAAIRTDDTGTLLSWNPNFDGRVMSVTLTADGVYAGGNFNQVGGQARVRLARLDKSTGSPDSWNPSATADVWSLLALNAGASILAGGNFTHVNMVTRTRAAAFDANGLVTPWQPTLSSDGNSIAVVGNTAYVAGGFTTANGVTRNRAASFKTDDTGTLTSWDPNLNGYAQSIAIRGMTAYLVGGFTTVNGGTTRNRAAAVKIDDTGTLTSWDPNLNDVGFFVTVDDTLAYIGGNFSTVKGTARTAAAAVTLDGAGTLTPWNPQPNGAVWDIATRGGTAYLVGEFSTVKGMTRNLAAAVSLDDTATLTSWNPDITCPGCAFFPPPRAYAIELSGSTAYIGGQFDTVNGVSGATGLVAVSADDTGAQLGTWSPSLKSSGPTSTIQSIRIAGGLVHVGGTYGSLSLNNVGYAGSVAAVPALGPAPVITTVTPNSGSTAGGTTVTISGAAFVNGATVTIGGAACTVTSTTATSIVCTSPAGAAGAQSVVVTNPDTQATTLVGGYTYINPPAPAPAQPPGAPTSATAIPGNASATVSWLPPADTGTYPIDGYVVRATPGGSSCSGTATTCTVTGLANGTSYTFTVTASSPAGLSPASAPSNAVTPRTTPGPPTGVTATPGNTTATVTWTAPSDDGGSPITGYRVTTVPASNGCTTTVTQCALTGLTNGQTYVVTVKASNLAGDSTSSIPTSVTPRGPASILIVGSRDKTDARIVRIAGTVTNLDVATAQPYYRLGNQTEFQPSIAPAPVTDGAFTWQRNTSRRISIYVIAGDTESNKVTIRAR